MKLFCIRDRVAGVYSMIFEAMSVEDAKRRLQMSAASGKSLLSIRPGDFDLAYIGDFIEDHGVINGPGVPIDDGKGVTLMVERICPLDDFIKPGYDYVKISDAPAPTVTEEVPDAPAAESFPYPLDEDVEEDHI